jgi:hypothetical protein
MLKKAAIALFALGTVVQLGAYGGDFIARFDGGIGVIPVSNGAGVVQADGTLPSVTLNVVRGVSPAAPWTIAGLRADVDADGRIQVKGRGLLLANGNRIGQNANQSVFATLICETAAPFVEHSTDRAGVPLEANGDFSIDDVLDPAPAECASPVLLIRTINGTRPWFAAGIPKLGDD